MSQPADWAQLSPLLDELLDLDEPARAARLATLREQDAALAERLGELLARDAALSQAGFLGAPAVPGLAALQALPAAAAVALSAGDAVGPYTLVRLLGEGGMGSVWLARRSDGRFEGEVAIKFLRAELLGFLGGASPGGPSQAERFAREGAILARLAHPHIARLLDAGVARDGALPYLVLEYVAGEPIDRWCDARSLDISARVRLMRDVLDAVAHAHNRLILHRDLKPSNILVTPEGRALLLDFGIAKLLDGDAGNGVATELTQRAGAAYTPYCAAPEQLQGGEVTTATDVYALGVLLYGLLGGGHPTTPPDATPLERLRTVLEVVPRRLSEAAATPAAARVLRGDLDTIVAKALKKAPAERYANAAALADDLRRWLAHQPITARPDSRLYLAGRFIRRHRVAVAATSAAALALTVAITGALLEGREARRQRDQAEGLIEFMLGDLRRRLQPVGRLDVLDAVGARVLAHYAAEAPERLDADALGRRTRALHLIGELAEKRGRLDEAAQRFGEAAHATELLLARAPHDGQRVFDHAQSVYWLGYIARRRGQTADCEAQFGRYLSLAEQLVALDPARRDWQTERAYALQNLGIVQLEAGRAREALAAFSQARTVFNADAAQQPAAGRELANTLGWVAMAHAALGEHAAARTALQAKLAALQRLPGAERESRVQQQLASTWRELGALALLDGPAGHAEAAAAMAQALQRSQALVALDGANLDWLAQTLLVHLDQTELARANGDTATMRAQLQLARPALERLLATDASKLYWQVDLRGGYLRQALPLGLATADDVAQYLAQLAQREASGTRLDALQRRMAAEVALQLADHLAAQGQRAQALPLWQAVVERLAGAVQQGDFRAICLQAQALWALGQLQQARALADRVETSAFRHPVYADLRRRLAAAP